VPAGLDQDHPSARPQAGQQIGLVPVPGLVAYPFGFGILTRADGVIDDDTIGPEARDAGADAGRIVFAAVDEFPAASGVIVRSEAQAEGGVMPGDQVANPTTPFLGELCGVGGGEQGASRLPRQNVRREQHRAIGGFGRAWRHEHRQPFDLAAIDPFKPVDQQAMMDGGLVTAMTAPGQQAPADLSPPQQCLDRQGGSEFYPGGRPPRRTDLHSVRS
jgi:hypothetical protein